MSDPPEISEFTQGFLAAIPFMEDRKARELAQLLINQDGAPKPPAAREAVIGLLARMRDETNGCPVSETAYDERRADESTEHPWPPSHCLVTAYGSWGTAVDVADMVRRGQTRGVSTNAKHWFGPKPSYTRTELLMSLIYCAIAIGRWPHASGYVRWADVERCAQRQKTSNARNVPSLKPFNKEFEDFDDAIRHAKQLAVQRRLSTP